MTARRVQLVCAHDGDCSAATLAVDTLSIGIKVVCCINEAGLFSFRICTISSLWNGVNGTRSLQLKALIYPRAQLPEFD